ncbi:MAG TPA: LLM class flavin-dependent oxidoreductase [Pseudonocardia sp.]|jgi:phthiodiolone/phenolphthiodiolone dimycocerosates ketoreductase
MTGPTRLARLTRPRAHRDRFDRVRVGLFFEPIAPLPTVRANINIARASGADDIWFADHTKSLLPTAAWDPSTNPMAKLVPDLDAYFDPTAVISRYAGAGGLTMGSCVTDAIRRTPADLARAWLSMHHLSKGRVILGIGSGEAENTVPYGLALDRPVSRLDDALTAIRAAWASHTEPVDHSGPFHTWRDATFALPGWHDTHPPIWVAGQGPRASRIAGAHGDGWIHIHENFDHWSAGWEQVQAGAARAGRDPGRMERSLLIATLLVPTEKDLLLACTRPTVRAFALAQRGSAWTAAGGEHPFGRDFGGFSEINPAEITPATFAEAGRAVTPEVYRRLMPCGAAGQVVDYLRRFIDAGVTHITVLNIAPTCGVGIAARSLLEQRRLVHQLKRIPLSLRPPG